MRWFCGDVGGAIAAAKRQQVLFVVFVKGGEDEEPTKQLKQILLDEDVAGAFSSHVCIEVEKGSTTFTQFSQLYPVLIVPCIVYIDSTTGMDLEVTVNLTTKEGILAGLERALEKRRQSESAPVSSPAAEDFPAQAADGPEDGSAGSSSSRAPADLDARVSRARELLDENVARMGGEVRSHDTPTSMEERVARAKRLMQQRQQEKERVEQEKEKEKELERRALGKNLLDFKQKQEEEEVKKAALERRREKEETLAARERVKAQIEQDRADRAARFNREKGVEEEKKAERLKREQEERSAQADQAAADRSSVARLQFRLPDGRSQTHQFPAESPLDEIYSYVAAEVQTGFTSFSLSTTFPRHDLDTKPRTTTLRELQMAPSATVLILPKGGGGSGIMAASDGSFASFLNLLLYPFTILWGLVLSLFGTASGSTNEPPRDKSGLNKQGAKIGRIRRSEKDDDENNTYNGNSTQQM